MIEQQITDINKLFNKLTELSQENKQTVVLVNQTVNQILTVPLQAIIETSQYLQEKMLSPRQQKELINKIQYLSNEALNILNNLVNLSQSALKQTIKNVIEEEDINFSQLMGVQTLLIDDNGARRQDLQLQLQALGLLCTAVTIQEALPTLQQALQSDTVYQIIIVSNEQFEHHAAYLGRTIKANPNFNNIMPVLALATNKLLDFEIERAHFSGFTCVLNQTPDFPKKLVAAWHSWNTKHLFRESTSPAKHQHILIVEDEPTAQFCAQQQLKQLGFAVDIAADGQQALKLLENNSYDLIFMDIGLPDISGLEVTAEIRKREQGKIQTPIIGLTVYALEEEKPGLAIGMNEYLIKPLVKSRLQEILQKWLRT